MTVCLELMQAPPEWHPASKEVKAAADKARAICAEKGTDLATISLKRFMRCAARQGRSPSTVPNAGSRLATQGLISGECAGRRALT